MTSTKPLLDTLVDRFLACPLPESVCADPCSTVRGYPHRTGTTLLTAVEAREVLSFVLADLQKPCVWHRIAGPGGTYKGTCGVDAFEQAFNFCPDCGHPVKVG